MKTKKEREKIQVERKIKTTPPPKFLMSINKLVVFFVFCFALESSRSRTDKSQ